MEDSPKPLFEPEDSPRDQEIEAAVSRHPASHPTSTDEDQELPPMLVKIPSEGSNHTRNRVVRMPLSTEIEPPNPPTDD